MAVNGRDRLEARNLRAGQLAKSGDHARAAAEAEDLLKANPPLSDRGLYYFAGLFSLAAESAARDKRLDDASRRSLIERHVGRSVALLKQVGDLGFFKTAPNLEDLKKNETFSPLHGRGDFQLLLLDLGFPSNPFQSQDGPNGRDLADF